ncbi:MAG: DUF5723 family protein [Flavobacteriales bacterium]
MIRLITTTAALVLSLIAFTQSDTYYMNDWTSTSQWNYNPALQSKAKVFLYIPVLSGTNVHAGHTGFSFDDAVQNNQLNITGLINGLEDENHLLTQTRTDLFGFGLKFGNVQVRAGVQNVGDLRFAYSKDFLELIWKGNGHPDVIGRRMNMDGTSANGISYMSYFLGGSASLLDNKLNIGLNANIYNGIGTVFTESSSFGLTTNATDYAVTVDGGYDVRTAGTDLDSSETKDFLPFSNNGNNGFGVDLGITYAVTEKLTIEASALDLGQIKWTQNVENYQLANTEISYSGFELNEFINSADSAQSVIEQFSDSISDAFVPTENSDSFTTSMNHQIFIRGVYDLNDNNEISAFVSQQKSYGTNFVNFGALYAHNFGRVLKLRTGFQMFRSKDLIIPVGLVLHAGPVELGLHTDNILSVIQPNNTKHLSGMFSIGFLFGKEKDNRN